MPHFPNQAQMEDWLIGQDASFIKVATPPASTTMSEVNMTSPITLPDQTEEEKQYVLVVTTSIRRLNLEMTGVILGETVTTPPGRSAFQNPHMVAVLLGRVINNQVATVTELDAKWGPQVMS